MKYLIYARVSPKGSTWAGTETSIPDQVEQCQSYVLARDTAADFVVVTDEFQSAGSTKRPGYQQVIDELQQGSADWDVLVVRHIDRMSRSLTDAIDILELLKTNGKGLISTTQQLDMSTPTGRAMLHIILIFAQWEREMGSERTKMKMRSIASSGGWPSGKCPMGYRRGGKGNNILLQDPVAAERVAGIFRDYAGGVQPIDIIRKYNLAHRQRLYGILRNKFYIGIIDYDGELFKGKHKALIDQDTWQKVQSSIGPKKTRKLPKAWKRPYILAGLIRCTCGRSMTPASAHGRNKVYSYYQCTDAIKCRKRIAAEEVEGIILDRLRTLDMEQAEIETMKKMARSYFKMVSPAEGEIDRVRDAIRDAKKERDRIKRLFTDGIVNAENAGTFNDDLSKRTAELNRLEGRLDALLAISQKETSELFKVDAALEGFQNLREGLLAADDAETQQQIVQTFVKTICCTAGGFAVELADGSSVSHDWPAEGDCFEPPKLVAVFGDGPTTWAIR